MPPLAFYGFTETGLRGISRIHIGEVSSGGLRPRGQRQLSVERKFLRSADPQPFYCLISALDCFSSCAASRSSVR